MRASCLTGQPIKPRETMAAHASPKPHRAGLWLLVALIAALAALRGIALLYDHSLHSIDGVLQTWFALEGFTSGKQLGEAFQSYLGVTMILALAPLFAAFGGTLFASTLSATIAVIAGAFGTAYAIAWLIRFIAPRQRWMVAVVLVFAFFIAGRWPVEMIGYRYPLSFDPGVSLRAVRGLLPIIALPAFVLCVRSALAGREWVAGAGLGGVSGAGLLWSNDAGIPLLIATFTALMCAMPRRPVALGKTLAAWSLGTIAAAAGVLMLVTHAEPSGWLQYNFGDVAGDQFWYFGPWDRETRVLGAADLRFILMTGDPLTTVSLVLLALSVCVAGVMRLLERGSPVRLSAFIMIGAATLGTALIAQVGGHIDASYNAITVFLGACAPLIVFQRQLLRLARPAIAAFQGWALPALACGAALALVAVEGQRTFTIMSMSERTIYAEELGFFVTRETQKDLSAMQTLARHWDKAAIPPDRRMLSVYTSVLDIAAGAQSPKPVGSLIHALGPSNRAGFRALVDEQAVQTVTTIAPDYSGWEGWISRANWPFFKALRENYRPVARTNQHILWMRAQEAQEPLKPAPCRVIKRSEASFTVEILPPVPGLASIDITRSAEFGTGRSAVLVVTEQSAYTNRASQPQWSGFPSYGVANSAHLTLLAPAEKGASTTLTLELLDGSPIGDATCQAVIYPALKHESLPSLTRGIAAFLGQGAP